MFSWAQGADWDSRQGTAAIPSRCLDRITPQKKRRCLCRHTRKLTVSALVCGRKLMSNQVAQRRSDAHSTRVMTSLLNMVWLRADCFGFIIEYSIVQVVLRNHLKQVTGKLGFIHANGFRSLAQP